MKKLWNLAFGYFLAAMAGGVFYREFTKYFGFTGETALGYLHVHLLVLGTVLFLFLGLAAKSTDLLEKKQFHTFGILPLSGYAGAGNPPGDRCFCFPWGRCCNLRDCRADAYCDCGGMDFLVYHFAQIKIRSTDQDRSLL